MDNIFHVSFPGLGLENLTINRIAFVLDLFGRQIPVYWYGLIIASAFMLTLLLSIRHPENFGFSQDDILDAYLWIIPLSLVGARAYYVAFSWSLFKDNWRTIFQTRNGGMAFYGGIIGGIVALLIVAALKKIKVADYLDYLVPYVALGQAIGRWGNFFNQEAFGTNTRLPWGMISEGTTHYLESLGEGFAPMSPVHPTFLYEFLGNLLIFFILIYIRNRSSFSYQTVLTYVVLYGALRFFVEGIRTDSLMIAHTEIRVSQALSAVMVVVGILALLLLSTAVRKKPVQERLVPFSSGHAARQLAEDEGITDSNQPPEE